MKISRSTLLAAFLAQVLFSHLSAGECVGTRVSSCSEYDVDFLTCSIPGTIVSCIDIIDTCRARGCNTGCICSRRETGCRQVGFINVCNYAFSCEGGPLPCSSITDRTDCLSAGDVQKDECEWIDEPTPTAAPAPPTPKPTALPTITLSPTSAPTEKMGIYTQTFLVRFRRATYLTDSSCSYGTQTLVVTCTNLNSSIAPWREDEFEATSCVKTAENTMVCTNDQASSEFADPARDYIAFWYQCQGDEVTASTVTYQPSDESCNIVLPAPDDAIFTSALQLATRCDLGPWKSGDSFTRCIDAEASGTFDDIIFGERFTCWVGAPFERTSGAQILSFPVVSMGTDDFILESDRCYTFQRTRPIPTSTLPPVNSVVDPPSLPPEDGDSDTPNPATNTPVVAAPSSLPPDDGDGDTPNPATNMPVVAPPSLAMVPGTSQPNNAGSTNASPSTAPTLQSLGNNGSPSIAPILPSSDSIQSFSHFGRVFAVSLLIALL